MPSSGGGTQRIGGRSSMGSAPTARNSSEVPKPLTTSCSWFRAGTDLAHADFYAPIPWLGNPVGWGDQRLATARASGEDPLGGDAHSRQDRFHAFSALKRKRIIGWIRTHLIGVPNHGNVRRLSARHLRKQPLYFLFRLLGKFVAAALEIEGKGNRAGRLGRERTAKNVFDFALTCGAALHAALGRRPRRGEIGRAHV